MKVLAVFLSYKCNNICQFCVQTSVLRNNFLDREFLLSKLDSLVTNVDKIIISGGEPFLNKDLCKLLNYLKKKNFDGEIEIESNGRLITVDQLSYFIEMWGCKKLKFMISIHGLEKIHNTVVGNNSAFSETIRGMKLVKNAGISFKTNTVIHALNLDSLVDIYKFLKDSMAPNVIQFSLMDYIGKACQNNIACLDRHRFIQKINVLLETVCIRHEKISLEKIPFCFLNNQYRPNVIKEKSREFDLYYYLMPKKCYLQQTDRHAKESSCNKCKYFEFCEGIYPSLPEEWLNFNPIK